MPKATPTPSPSLKGRESATLSRSQRTRPSLPDLWLYEREAFAAGHELVAGVDEAGRGPLAGPVVAACVVLPRGFDPAGINDSKQLTEPRRKLAYDRICREAVAVGVAVVHHELIDRINILRATHVAMREAILRLEPAMTLSIVLVDGLPVPGLPCAVVRALVKGDALSISIAAASIVAKVTRDRLMALMDRRYPGYGFDRHKGYSAPAHLAALRQLGPSPIHRHSFAPVAAACHPALELDNASGDQNACGPLEPPDMSNRSDQRSERLYG
jgi:ribonuclease HII